MSIGSVMTRMLDLQSEGHWVNDNAVL